MQRRPHVRAMGVVLAIVWIGRRSCWLEGQKVFRRRVRNGAKRENQDLVQSKAEEGYVPSAPKRMWRADGKRKSPEPMHQSHLFIPSASSTPSFISPRPTLSCPSVSPSTRPLLHDVWTPRRPRSRPRHLRFRLCPSPQRAPPPSQRHWQGHLRPPQHLLQARRAL